MDNQTATASDHAKVVVAIILMIGSCIPLVGIVPAAISALGFLIAWNQRNFSTIITTTRWNQVLIALAGAAVAITLTSERTYDNEPSPFAIAFVVVSAWIILLEFLWMRPMTRIIENIGERRSLERSEIDIVKRDSLSSYSVAEELRKWRDLRDDGTVSEEEYQAARSKIMQ